MNRQEQTIFWGGVFVLILLFNIATWPLLALLAWYVKRIPDKRLPMAALLSGNQKRFYDWLSDFLSSWLKSAITVTFIGVVLVAIIGGVLWFESTRAMFSVPDLLWHPRFLAFLFYVIVVIATLLALHDTKSAKWDVLFWQAEPTVKVLVGSEEYENMLEEDKQAVKRNVVDSLIGINKATIVVAGGKIQTPNPPAGEMAKFGGPGVLIVQEGHAVVLERGGRRSRIVGTGVWFLGIFERVSLVIPLMPRSIPLEIENVVTQDRMVVSKIKLTVFTRVDLGDRSHENGNYPFDDRIINDRIWSPRAGPEVYDWSGIVKSVADTALRDLAARLRLDDLVLASGRQREELRTNLKDLMNRVTQDRLGVVVNSVVIGEIVIPEKAQQSLLTLWLEQVNRQSALIKAESERDVTVRKGEGEAIALRRVEEIKSNLREVLIRQLTDPILGSSGAAIRDPFIAIRCIEAVEKLSLAIVRDDLTALRYVEALEKIAEGGGNKTVVVGESQRLLT